jgi:hypothetical protein
MLFQTLVQLNILILATPALAGWIALPMAQPGVVRAACVVLQIRAVETVAPKQSPAETLSKAAAVRPVPLVLPRFVLASNERPSSQCHRFPDMYLASVASFHPFSHAIRAP